MPRDALAIAESILAAAPPDPLSAVLELCDPDSELVVDVLTRLADLDSRRARDAGGQPDPRVGVRAGPYRVLYRIGDGGYGEVYASVRHEASPPAQLVAIKFIKGKANVGPEAILRFHQEREIVARLSSNYIVRLFDAGDSDAGLFFSMEFVRGLKLDVFCNLHRLTVEERLELFLKVCSAVRHLHQYRIVHRDLKPANILVEADANPKLLDFGIADYMEPERMGRAPLDPKYRRRLTQRFAAPELTDGGPVGTAADVYSLGVILFCLLTGTMPPDPAVKIKASDNVVTSHPENCRERHIASVRKRLAGDLDTILAKALSFSPADRYSSAFELAADIENHLRCEPVAARKNEGWRYVLGCGLRRHRSSIAALSAFVISLACGLGLSLYQRTRAERARYVAVQELNTLKILAKDVEESLVRVKPETERRNAEFLGAFSRQFELLGDKDPDDRPVLYATALRLRTASLQEWERLGDSSAAGDAREDIGFLKGKATRDAGRAPSLPDLTASTESLAESYRAVGRLLLAAGDLSGAGEAFANCSTVASNLLARGANPQADALIRECRAFPQAR